MESYSANSVRLAFAACSTFWTWLEAEQYADRKPWVQISYPRKQYRKAVKPDQGRPDPVMNDAEYKASMQTLNQKARHKGNKVYDKCIRESAKN